MGKAVVGVNRRSESTGRNRIYLQAIKLVIITTTTIIIIIK